MTEQTAQDLIELARDHLGRVQIAWTAPTDWTDLTLYGFYCLEAAVMAAAKHLGWSVRRSHTAKVEAAERLSREYGLPEISDLLSELNSARKAVAYGDIPLPRLNAELLASQVETYVQAIQELFE